MSKREQLRVCLEIAFECSDFNPAKRPFIEQLIDRLDKTETIDTQVCSQSELVDTFVANHWEPVDMVKLWLVVTYIVYCEFTPWMAPSCSKYT